MILIPLFFLLLLVVAPNLLVRYLFGGFNPLAVVAGVLVMLLAYRYLCKRIDRGT